MMRYTATPSIGNTYDVNEIDADGIGRRRYFVGTIPEQGTWHSDGSDITRLAVLALTLPGGIKSAIGLLRAELARLS